MWSGGEGDLLELRGREEPERRVPSAAVVEAFDEAEDFGAQLGALRPGTAVDEFLLQRREEAFGDGVVVAVALAAH